MFLITFCIMLALLINFMFFGGCQVSLLASSVFAIASVFGLRFHQQEERDKRIEKERQTFTKENQNYISS